MKNLIFIIPAIALLSFVVLAQDGNSPGGKIVLKVDSREITRDEFERLLWEYRGREFMEQLVDISLVEAAAKKHGVTVTREQVEKRLDDMLLQELASCQNDIEKFREELALYGYTVEKRRRANCRETRLVMLAEELVKHERSTEEKVRELFEQRYAGKKGKVVRPYHMLISTEEMLNFLENRVTRLKLKITMTPGPRRETLETELAGVREKIEKWKTYSSKKLAGEIVRKLRAGEKFEELARDYGAGYTSEYYDLGWVTREGIFKLLVPVLFEQLKPGEVGEPVQSRYGFHVVKLVDKKDASELEYDEVKAFLQDELKSRHADRHEVEHLMRHLREEAEIVRDIDALDIGVKDEKKNEK